MAGVYLGFGVVLVFSLSTSFFSVQSPALNLVMATTFGIAGNHYQAYAYVGLSKIAKISKQDNIAKNYWKKAEELAEYKYIFDY